MTNESILLYALCWVLEYSEVFRDKVSKELSKEEFLKFYNLMEKATSMKDHDDELFNDMIEQMKEVINKEGN